VQALALAPLKRPLAQAVQLVAFGGEYLPLAQASVQATERLIEVWYFPASHSAHSLAPPVE